LENYKAAGFIDGRQLKNDNRSDDGSDEDNGRDQLPSLLNDLRVLAEVSAPT
jgi:hypothetical protein